MVNDIGKELHTKVLLFKKWAETNYPEINEDNDNGEWCFCAEFDEMYSAAVDMITENSATVADEQIINDLLYAIARDNECENIKEILEKHDDWFSLLCRSCLHSTYTNAKWQFSKALENYSGNDDLKNLVFEFLSTGDEYTERMALKSLASIDPIQAEKYALKFWNREIYEHDEYQKIMVLHVLYQIRSVHLDNCLEIAEKSGYKYLRMNAEEIREKIKADKSLN